MDLTLFMRVVWRYRLLVLSGFMLAALLAFFALVRITPGGPKVLTLRGEGQYQSTTTVFVTQPGFPWGRLPKPDPNDPNAAPTDDSARLSSLATLYAKLVDTESVKALSESRLPKVGWSIVAQPVLDGAGLASPLPLISIASVANSPDLAKQAVSVTTDSLISYISTRQTDADIPASQRVVLQRIDGPTDVKTLKGKSITFPIVIFVLFSMLTLGAPFVIDNIRRSLRAVRGKGDGPDAQVPPGPRPAYEDFDFDDATSERRGMAGINDR